MFSLHQKLFKYQTVLQINRSCVSLTLTERKSKTKSREVNRRTRTDRQNRKIDRKRDRREAVDWTRWLLFPGLLLCKHTEKDRNWDTGGGGSKQTTRQTDGKTDRLADVHTDKKNGQTRWTFSLQIPTNRDQRCDPDRQTDRQTDKLNEWMNERVTHAHRAAIN